MLTFYCRHFIIPYMFISYSKYHILKHYKNKNVASKLRYFTIGEMKGSEEALVEGLGVVCCHGSNGVWKGLLAFTVARGV